MPIKNRHARVRPISGIRGDISDAFNDWADLRDELPSGDPDKAIARAVANKLERALVLIDEARDKARAGL